MSLPHSHIWIIQPQFFYCKSPLIPQYSVLLPLWLPHFLWALSLASSLPSDSWPGCPHPPGLTSCSIQPRLSPQSIASTVLSPAPPVLSPFYFCQPIYSGPYPMLTLKFAFFLFEHLVSMLNVPNENSRAKLIDHSTKVWSLIGSSRFVPQPSPPPTFNK